MRTGRPIINEERCVIDKVTGQPTWNLTTKVPLRNAADEIVGIVGIGRDITERKQAEEAYHAIVDHSLQGLFVIQNMRVVFANGRWQRSAATRLEEMLAASPARCSGISFIPWIARWSGGITRLGSDGESLPDQYEFRIDSQGWLGPVARKSIPAAWNTRAGRRSRPPASIRRNAVRAEEALRRSEARNLALLNANPDLMFRLSRGGVFLDCKPPKDDAVSASPAQFVGKHLEEVFPAALARTLMRHIQAAIETGHVQTLEYSLPGPDGEDSDFECRLVACAEQEVVAIVRDISDRRRAERLARLQRDVAIRLSSQSDLKEGLQFCLEAAIKASHMDCGGIYTMDDRTGSPETRRPSGTVGRPSSHVPRHTRRIPDIPGLSWKASPSTPRIDRLGVPIGPVQKAERLRAVGIIPIKHDGRVVACLNVASHTSDEVPQRSRIVLETIAAQIGSAISRLKIQEALQRAEQEKAVILNTMPQVVIYHDVVAPDPLGQPDRRRCAEQDGR